MSLIRKGLVLFILFFLTIEMIGIVFSAETTGNIQIGDSGLDADIKIDSNAYYPDGHTCTLDNECYPSLSHCADDYDLVGLWCEPSSSCAHDGTEYTNSQTICSDSSTLQTCSNGSWSSTTCSLGYECSNGACNLVSVCGDGTKEGSEECDDGDTATGDGCSDTCTIESGWNCTGSTPSTCNRISVTGGGGGGGPSAVCGNGTKESGEECDDGNTNNGDGCSSTCKTEVIIPSTTQCGDGLCSIDENYSSCPADCEQTTKQDANASLNETQESQQQTDLNLNNLEDNLISVDENTQNLIDQANELIKQSQESFDAGNYDSAKSLSYKANELLSKASQDLPVISEVPQDVYTTITVNEKTTNYEVGESFTVTDENTGETYTAFVSQIKSIETGYETTLTLKDESGKEIASGTITNTGSINFIDSKGNAVNVKETSKVDSINETIGSTGIKLDYSPTEEEIEELLKEAGITGEKEVSAAKEAMKDLSFEKEVKTIKITKNGTEVYQINTIVKVKNSSNNNLKNAKLIDVISKNTVPKASLIESKTKFNVIIEDPVIEWIIPEIKAGEEIDFNYKVKNNKKPLYNEKEIKTLVASALFIEKPPSKECEKDIDCDDKNPCTIDSCIQGKCSKENVIDGTNCGENKQCKTGTCIEVTPAVITPTTGLGIEWIAAIIIVIIIILIILMKIKNKHKKKTRKH